MSDTILSNDDLDALLRKAHNENTDKDTGESHSVFASLFNDFRYLLTLRFEDDLVPVAEIYEDSWKMWDPGSYLGQEGSLLLGKKEIARVVLKKEGQGFFIEVLESLLPHDQEELRQMLLGTPFTVSVEVARAELPLKDFQNIGKESIIDFGRYAGEPVDVLMEEYDRVIAQGEVVVIDDEYFGVRITDIPEGSLADRTLPKYDSEESIHDIPTMTVRCIVGSAVLELEDLARLEEKSLIVLDKLAGSSVDVVLGEKIVLKGEVIVIDESFKVRIKVRIMEDVGEANAPGTSADEPSMASEEEDEDPYDEYTNKELIKKIKKTLADDPELTARVMKSLVRGPSMVAFLLAVLGEDLASEMIELLDEDTVLELTQGVTAGETTLSEEEGRQALKEFLQVRDRLKGAVKIGHEYIQTVLTKGLGKEKAIDIVNRLTSSWQKHPFDLVRRTNPALLLNFIQGEHPQTISLILSYLDSNKASQILGSLPHQIQADVARRIALMDRTTPDVLREVERVLERKLVTLASEDYAAAGGIDTTVEILKLVDRGTGKLIIEALEEDDPELAEEIKKKIFVFEDIVQLDDRAIQKVLLEVDMSELAKAFKSVDTEVQEKIYRNMSERAASLLQEDMEFMGAIRIEEVEKSQQKIVDIIRKLEERGELVVARVSEEEFIT